MTIILKYSQKYKIQNNVLFVGRCPTPYQLFCKKVGQKTFAFAFGMISLFTANKA